MDGEPENVEGKMMHPSKIKIDQEKMFVPVFIEVWENEGFIQETFTSKSKIISELDLFDESFLSMTEENSFLEDPKLVA